MGKWTDKVSIDEEVTNLVRKGWQPYGPMAIENAGSTTTIFYQAMVKYDSELQSNGTNDMRNIRI
mgnify:CR=1 FL=1